MYSRSTKLYPIKENVNEKGGAHMQCRYYFGGLSFLGHRKVVLGTQSGSLEQAASPVNVGEMQDLHACLRPTESESAFDKMTGIDTYLPL